MRQLVALLIFALAACSDASAKENYEPSSTTVASLESKITELEKRLEAVEALGEQVKALEAALETLTGGQPITDRYLYDADGNKKYKVIRQYGITVDVETPLGTLQYMVNYHGAYADETGPFSRNTAEYYSGADCTGNKILLDTVHGRISEWGSVEYFPKPTWQRAAIVSVKNTSGVCSNNNMGGFVGWVVPATENPLDITAYNLEYPLSVK